MYNESSDDHPGVDWSDREKAASLSTGGEGNTEIHKAIYGFRRANLTPLWPEIGPRRIDLYRSTQKLYKESAWQGPRSPNPNKKNRRLGGGESDFSAARPGNLNGSCVRDPVAGAFLRHECSGPSPSPVPLGGGGGSFSTPPPVQNEFS